MGLEPKRSATAVLVDVVQCDKSHINAAQLLDGDGGEQLLGSFLPDCGDLPAQVDVLEVLFRAGKRGVDIQHVCNMPKQVNFGHGLGFTDQHGVSVSRRGVACRA